MWGRMETYKFPAIHDYASAEAAWMKCKPMRAQPDTHWLVDGSRDKTIALTDNDYVLSYGGCEVVRYSSIGQVHITSHATTSGFGDFANALLPPALSVDYRSKLGYVVSVASAGDDGAFKTHWRFSSTIVMYRGPGGAWRPHSGSLPFEIIALDKAAARAALKAHRFQDICDFARAFYTMNPRYEEIIEPGPHCGPSSIPGRMQIMRYVLDPSQWERMVREPGIVRTYEDTEAKVRKFADAVRVAIYWDAQCATKLFHDKLVGANALKNAVNNNTKYRWAKYGTQR